MSQKRLAKEFAECTATPPTGMTVALAGASNLHKWHVTLAGPPNTPYAAGTFGITITLPTEYPFKPPIINFVTRIYHPNITNDAAGNICLAGLKSDNWKPASRILGILEGLRQLLVEPMPEDPLESSIADEYRNDRPGWEKKVKEQTAKYAKGAVKFPGPGG